MAALAEAKLKAASKPAAPKPVADHTTSTDMAPKPKSGRGMRKEERSGSIEAKQPWVALGITRRAWYYRRAKDRETKQ